MCVDPGVGRRSRTSSRKRASHIWDADLPEGTGIDRRGKTLRTVLHVITHEMSVMVVVMGTKRGKQYLVFMRPNIWNKHSKLTLTAVYFYSNVLFYFISLI